jgi:hypothetical protein
MTKWKPDSWMGPWKKGTKHTPGPWTAEIPKPVHLGHYAAGQAAKISEVGSITTIASLSVFNNDWQDNARLIAAAPDMLAALQEVEWIFDGEEDITNNGGPNNAMKALQVVRAALRKAGAA